MKIFNQCIAILLSIVPIVLSAAANFDLINANFALPKADVIYYRYEITGTNPVAKTGIKQLRGIFSLRLDVKNGQKLVLELSADPNMATKVTYFEFSPEKLQEAVSNLKEASDALKRAGVAKTSASEKNLLEAMQKGAVKATTCYIAARVKSPIDKTVILLPQNPTTQYSKTTAQGLSLQANVSPILLKFLETLIKWRHDIEVELKKDGQLKSIAKFFEDQKIDPEKGLDILAFADKIRTYLNQAKTNEPRKNIINAICQGKQLLDLAEAYASIDKKTASTMKDEALSEPINIYTWQVFKVNSLTVDEKNAIENAQNAFVEECEGILPQILDTWYDRWLTKLGVHSAGKNLSAERKFLFGLISYLRVEFNI